MTYKLVALELPIELEFTNVDFVEGGNPENPEQGREPATKINPIMTPGLGFERGPHWWEESVTPPLHTPAPAAISQMARVQDLWLFNYH